MKPAAPRDKVGEKTLKHQAEVDVESHIEEEKAAEFKNQVQHSNIRRWPGDNKSTVASGKKTCRTVVA